MSKHRNYDDENEDRIERFRHKKHGDKRRDKAKGLSSKRRRRKGKD